MKFIFFGTPKESVIVLEELAKNKLLPELIVTAPDRPAGRGLKMQESPVALWGKENKIEVFKPESLKIEESKIEIKKYNPDFAIVFAYGKIIPQTIIDIFAKGMLNIHPSLLPKYRGPSPVESAILAGEEKTGVSIMLIDEKMDHGPILAQEEIDLITNYEGTDISASSGLSTAPEIMKKLVEIGAKKIVEILPDFLADKITPKAQDHDLATYTEKITKADGEINLDDDPKKNYLKYLAYFGTVGVYFFDNNKARIKITRARFENNKFIIDKIIPEGKKEINYQN